MRKSLHRPGIEPGPPAWQASILPLNQRCYTWKLTETHDTSKFWKCQSLCLNKKLSQLVGFEPTLPEGNWFLVSRLNHSATTAELKGPATSLANIEQPICWPDSSEKEESFMWHKYNFDPTLSCQVIGWGKNVSNQVILSVNYSCPASSVGRAWDS